MIDLTFYETVETIDELNERFKADYSLATPYNAEELAIAHVKATYRIDPGSPAGFRFNYSHAILSSIRGQQLYEEVNADRKYSKVFNIFKTGLLPEESQS